MEAVVLASIPSGSYINGYAALAMVVGLFVWAALMTWVDKDAPACHLPRQIINAGMYVALALAVGVFLLLPLGFWADISVYMGLLAAAMGAYLGLRYQKVGLGDLTKQMQAAFKRSGGSKKEAKAAAGQVVIINKAGVPIPTPDAQTPERQQYDVAQQILAEPMRRNAERIEVAGSNDGATVTYMVDGFQFEGPFLDRSALAGAVGFFKFIASLDPTEKRKPQSGPFKTILNNTKRDMQVTTRGSSAGESMTILSEPKKRHSFRIDGLGLSPEQLEAMRKTVGEGSGLVLLAAPVGHGLTSLEYAIIRAHDAFLQHLLTVERHPDQEIEGVTQNALPVAATGQEEAKQVAWVISQEPDVVLMAEVQDSNAARDLAGYAENAGKRAYVGLRAASSFDALRQWRKLVGDDNLAVKSLRLVVASRTVRLLCEACKIGYTPDPTLLKKLNMDPGRVNKLFQARTSPMLDNKGKPVPCTFCGDLAFKGRTGVYELLVIDEEMRQLILNNGSEAELKKAFRNQKGRYLQEMALDLVEKGLTSVNEVQRVLRPAEGGSSGGGGGSGGASPRPSPRPAPAAAGSKRR